MKGEKKRRKRGRKEKKRRGEERIEECRREEKKVKGKEKKRKRKKKGKRKERKDYPWTHHSWGCQVVSSLDSSSHPKEFTLTPTRLKPFRACNL